MAGLLDQQPQPYGLLGDIRQYTGLPSRAIGGLLDWYQSQPSVADRMASEYRGGQEAMDAAGKDGLARMKALAAHQRSIPVADSVAMDLGGMLGSIAGKGLPGLPMDEASRMARAKEMGFDIGAYHGTKGDIRAFDPARRGAVDGTADSRNTFSFASNPETAGHYAHTASPQVIDKVRQAELEKQFYAHSAARPVSEQAWIDYLDGRASPVDAAKIGAWLEKGRTISRAIEENISDAPNTIPVFLRIKNPLVVDRGGVRYDPEVARRSVIDAMSAGNDGVIYKNTFDGGPMGDIYQVFDPANIRSRFAAFDPAKANSADLLAGILPFAIGAGLLASPEDALAAP